MGLIKRQCATSNNELAAGALLRGRPDKLKLVIRDAAIERGRVERVVNTRMTLHEPWNAVLRLRPNLSHPARAR